MSNAIALVPEGRAVDASIIDRVVATGDLAKLTPQERVSYYVATCRSLGLNPLTRPFEFIQLNGKLVMYTTKNCTDQLRSLHGVSVQSLRRETTDASPARLTTPSQPAIESCHAPDSIGS